MKELTSYESIDIQASPFQVWDVLTKLSNMEKWSQLPITFAGERELHKGSKIHWVDGNGQPYCIGTVTGFEPQRILRVSPQFTAWKLPVSPDVIASVFSLQADGDNTHLKFSYGDFSKVPDGDRLWRMYLDSISPVNKELEKIKELAEGNNG